MPDLVGDLGNPSKVAAALEPVVQRAIATTMGDLVTQAIPALESALTAALDGLTVTVTIGRKTE
jgi:hypothetical protein